MISVWIVVLLVFIVIVGVLAGFIFGVATYGWLVEQEKKRMNEFDNRVAEDLSVRERKW